MYACIATVGSVVLGFHDLTGLAVLFISIFVSCAIGLELYRRVRTEGSVKGLRFPQNLVSAINRNPRKFGGQIIHIAIVIMLVGVAASSLYESAKMFTLSVGDTYMMDPYTFTFKAISQTANDNNVVFVATLGVDRHGIEPQRYTPSITHYSRDGTFIRKPHIVSTLLKDTYVIVQDLRGEEATFIVKFIPLVTLIWLSMIVIVVGTIVSLRQKIHQ
jgi:cytochrome c-type biogenesis protein CcmF